MTRVVGPAIVVAAVGGMLSSTADSEPDTQVPLEPVKNAGLGVTPVYEGWYKTADGGIKLLVGYFNRNLREVLDIPVGAENRIEPGGPDRGQPTYFLTGRQWGVFTIPVPKDLGDRKLVWTLVANGQSASVPMGLNPLYEVEPLKDAALGNAPPVIRLEPGGAAFQGPPDGVAAVRGGIVGRPVPLVTWVTDDHAFDPVHRATDAPIMIKWTKFRGPGDVTFSTAEVKVGKGEEEAVTAAAFSAAGDYLLRVQANDTSGDGGRGKQCCWTNAYVRVSVTPAVP